MTVQYVFEDDTDWTELAITREQIDASQDVAEMTRWHQSMSHSADDIKAQLDAADYALAEDEDWRGRAKSALAFNLMGARRVARRLAVFGVDVSTPKSEFDRLCSTLKSEQENRNKLKARLLIAGRFAEAVRAEIGAASYARLQAQIMVDLDLENTTETLEGIAA